MDKLGKIHRHHWKECLKISRIAKFENGLPKTNEEIGPQSLKNYRHLYGGGTNLLPTIQTSVNFSRARDCTCTLILYIFTHLRCITVKFGSLTIFKALFPVVSTDFP